MMPSVTVGNRRSNTMELEALLERHLKELFTNNAHHSAYRLMGVIGDLDGFVKSQKLTPEDEHCVERALTLLFPIS